MFPYTSRYANQPIGEYLDPDGRRHRYLLPRTVPPGRLPGATDVTRVVGDGDRLDRMTWEALGDPEQFWRLCDANGALVPDELLAVRGRRLLLPLDPRLAR